MSTNVYNDILNNTAAGNQRQTPQLTVIEPVKREQGPVKVAAYCRVSTDMEIQQSSLETQIEAYKRIISEHPGWVLSGIYADKGISGTLVRRRTEFLRMIQDAKDGKINYILAKSISRFSRNTVDALEYIRLLKTLGVSVYFEKEHLDTGSTTSELILSILAATAQEEILTISTNLKMGRRMRAEDGIATWARTYGYRMVKASTGGRYSDKASEQWIICDEEAKVIRRIFQEFIEGWSSTEISKHLNDDGVPTSRGYGQWASATISRILSSEKYMGDVLLMKYYVKDPIQHIRVRNKGVVKQYYIKDHHPAIIDRETAEMAKKVAALRDNHNGTTQYPFYGLLKCPLCGENMVRVPAFLDNRFYVWTCGGKAPEETVRAKGTDTMRGVATPETGDSTSDYAEFKREKRTQCPPYAIWEESLLKAICAAAEDAGKDICRDTYLVGNDGPKEEAHSRRRDSTVGSWKYATLNYRKLITAVDSITLPTWESVKVKWAEGESTTVPLTINQRKRPNPVASAKDADVSGESITRVSDAVQNTIIIDGELVPKVYGIDSTRNEEREFWKEASS